MKQFKDSHALIGRNKSAALEAELKLKARNFSRSLDEIARAVNKDQSIQCEITSRGELILNTANVIGNKARITQENAKLLAGWITEVYLRRKLNAKRRKRKSEAIELGRESQTSE